MSWKRVRGHETQIEEFARAVRRGRLAHAYLFVGPAGIGKRLFAAELAKTLLCESPQDGRFEGCDRCAACAQLDAGTHPDFFSAARPPESAVFPIDLMRELCQHFSLKAARGRGKVVVIDDADDLNDEAANCFLKTLEEPPPGSVLILIGASTDRQKATIVSRCQTVRFRPLSSETVAELLKGLGVDDPALREQVAVAAEGSAGQGLTLADAELWQFRRTLLAGLSQPRIDAVGLAKAWVEFVQDAGKESVHQRRRARLVLRLVIDFLRTALAFALGGASASEADRPHLEALTRTVNTDQILAMLERCTEADYQIERNVGTPLVLEALLDSMAQRLG